MKAPLLLAGLLLIVLAALVTLSLVTHDTADLQVVRSEGFLTPRVENAGGTLGVYLSYYLLSWVGRISQYAVPLVLLLWGINRVLGRSAIRMVAWSCYLIAVAAGMALIRSLPYCPLRAGVVSTAVARGGLLGTFLADRLVRVVGRVGAYSLTGAVIAGGLVWVGGLEWLRRIVRGLEAFSVRRQRRRIPTKRPSRGGRRKPASPPPPEPSFQSTAAQPHDRGHAQEAVGGGDYNLPPLDLLEDPPREVLPPSDKDLRLSSRVLEDKLREYGVEATVAAAHPGPVITRYEVAPAPGVKVSRFLSLCDDLALAMRARSIRIVAPIPGKGAVGIEMPNACPQTVVLKEIVSSEAFRSGRGLLLAALGKDISGEPVVMDLAKAPHLLVAGSTGSGKSVCLNAITTGLLFRSTPAQVRFVMIDPKMLELTHYRGIPHLMGNVITSPRGAVRALSWAVGEMERRYKLLASATSRDIDSYNRKVTSGPLMEEGAGPLPYIVIIIDELADLMMSLPSEMEEVIGRLAQMARAVGIHLVVATQRPSVDVITGVIKANFPSRISFQVASKTDSRTILDANGAERLLGRGDMLYSPAGSAELVRVHGCFVSAREVGRVVRFWREQGGAQEDVEAPDIPAEEVSEDRMDDELYGDALRLVVRHNQGSASLLQRRLKIGYARAGRLIDMMERNGVVGPPDGSKPRDVLVDQSYLDRLDEDKT
jgi:S-DNA-T family DNA segregation ATPase FtsK/SpoIIIE